MEFGQLNSDPTNKQSGEKNSTMDPTHKQSVEEKNSTMDPTNKQSGRKETNSISTSGDSKSIWRKGPFMMSNPIEFANNCQ